MYRCMYIWLFSRSEGAGRATNSEDARAYPLRDRLDDAALAGRVAPFEQQDDARAGFLDPFLEMAELDLQLLQLLFIVLSLQLRLLVFSPAHVCFS